MSYREQAQALAAIGDLVVTHELGSRPVRTPELAAENRELAALALDLAQQPDGVPARIEQVLRALCRGDAAGTSLPEPQDGGFDWRAASGKAPMLLRDPARVFPFLQDGGPQPSEMLLLPWSSEGEADGVLWVASHDPARRFDAGDARLLRSLAGFAAAAQRIAAAGPSAREWQQAQARLADQMAQRAAAEHELRQSHAILTAAMETEAVGLAFYTLDGVILDCNAALERMSGYSREELRTITRWPDLATPEFAATTMRALTELREGGRTAPYMKQLVRKDGSRWWAMVAPTCLPGEGETRRCIAFVLDISETREAETALQASEERFQALVKGFAQAVWETDADGVMRTESPSWRALTGQGPGESLGFGWANAVHPDDRHFILRHWHEALGAGSPVNAEYRLRQAGGGWRWTNVRAAPVRNPDGSVARWVGMNIDVDARRQAEAALRESEGRFRVLAEASPALIFQLDEQGQVSYANRRSFEMVGLQVGANPDGGWGTLLHPDDGPRYIEQVRAAIAGRSSLQQRVRARAADGRWHWFESHLAPLFGQGGAYRGHVGIAIDVTVAVQAEQALREADRRKEEFLATLAHELRNPLAPISNAVHLLRRPDGRRTADRMVEMVGRQVRQMVRLVDDLMDVSRITQGKLELRREPLSLAEVLSMAVETSMPAIEAGRHELTVSLPEETLVLEADKVRLTQVFGNMLNNAARYTDRGGRIWLAAWREGAQVVVSVRDSGIGIPAAKLPHVFEMFSQAHRDSARGQAGLGIGLTMVRSLVELHGGSVEARSEGLGQGSEFIVRLPLAEAPQALPQQPGGPAEAPLEGRRILVVDDNGDAAESLALLLESSGAEVRTAREGPAGLALAREFAPHAVLLDLGMPGMDGFEVARRLRAEPRHAGLAIIALTGWGQEEDRRRTRDSGFDQHLTKPVDVGQLLDILVRIKPAD
ncbi:PAS domain S-box protein [Massilia sp. LjRoot122]|uniref:hybrid sensor histidine kinase/response regulator n=1 Tax=Massilia sp. LjRoot122 TaxID=3342257 RepID=UPI003ECD314A